MNEQDEFDFEQTTSIHSASFVNHSLRVPQEVVDKLMADIVPLIQGRDRAMTVTEIARRIGESTNGTSPKVRKAIKVVLCDYGVPLCGAHDGMYVALTPEEVRPAIENLDKRILGNMRDRDALRAILRRMERDDKR